MSGHSRWSNIKRTKEKSDAQKGKLFTKVGRELAVAVKSGGSDPDTNNKLKDAIAKAKACNMPNDSIQRAIKKASGELGDINYEEITYEGYGIGGVAVLVKCLTDNKNRTAGDVRHAFDKHGGSLGSTGCVSYLFTEKGIINVDLKEDFDLVFEIALDLGAEDIEQNEDAICVTTNPDQVFEIAEKLKEKVSVLDSARELVASNYVSLDDDKAKSFEKMIDMLEDLDDVQEVTHNAE